MHPAGQDLPLRSIEHQDPAVGRRRHGSIDAVLQNEELRRCIRSETVLNVDWCRKPVNERTDNTVSGVDHNYLRVDRPERKTRIKSDEQLITVGTSTRGDRVRKRRAG